MLGKVTHVTVYVKDQQAALDFYRDTLGFEVVADMAMEMGGPMRWVTVRPSGGEGPEIALWPGNEQQNTLSRIGEGTGICLECSDLDNTYSELTAKGVNFTMPPGDVPWGRHAMLADQDGNQLYIVQPAQWGG